VFDLRGTGAALVVAFLTACGGGGGGGGGGGLAAPAAVATFAGAGEVTVSWGTVSGATSYTIYWATAAGVTPATGTAIANATSPHVHSGLANGTTYYYVVVATNGTLTSISSEQSSATPLVGGSSIDPPWAAVPPAQVITLDYDGGKTSAQNGAELKTVIQNLNPGQRLEIGNGTWSINAFFTISLQGTAGAPIWVAAKTGETPVITRIDQNQNTINVGSGAAARYVALQGLDITGGDTALRIWDGRNVWIDNCHIHHCGGPGIEANSVDTAFLYITRNEINNTSGIGEGIYLGGNNGSVVTHDSIVALNHVHDTGGTQGDGIELKQGSYANWIVGNLVHDTNYPCILVYGTYGLAFNLVERNTCYNSSDNVMQVQGEAIVRNNLLMNGVLAFSSGNHQAQARELTVVHNTMINTNRAVNLSDWASQPNMTFANNSAYSKNGDAVRLNGSAGVEFVGNTTFGPVVGIGSGFVHGTGLGDFVNVTWTATQRDATPVALSPAVGAGDFIWAVADDITAAMRSNPLDSGCYDSP
jgi:hypothetical protein